jgi:hypothetical protein
MPVNSKHVEYQANEEIWQMCEDFVAGEQQVKAAGTKYLPKLSGQTPDSYEAYKNRAPFFGGVARTVSALTGAMFRKLPAINLPDALEYMRRDATGTGMSLNEVAIALTTEIMKTGRAGILIDRDEDGGKPYIVTYCAEDITNWDSTVGNQFIVLEEDKVERDPNDKFELVEVDSYRELTFDANGDYIVNIWEERQIDAKTKQKAYTIVQVIQPIKNGKPIKYIPFCAISPTGLDLEIDRPPILDMVNVLLAWWRVSADHAHAIHTICVPTPVISDDNVQGDDAFVMKLGPDSVLKLATGGKAEFLEFKGQGLSEVTKHKEQLMDMLGALGARLVVGTGNKTTIETAEGARIREATGSAILGSIIASVEAALEKVLRWAADWENVSPEEVQVKLNRELVSTSIDANMLTAMLNAVVKGQMSFDTFYKNLESAGLTDPGVDAKEEKERIKDNPEIAIEKAKEQQKAPPQDMSVQ